MSDDMDTAAAEYCAQYTTPFYECWMQHLNLYLLIAMSLNQERVNEMEQSCTVVVDDLPTRIDWTEWTKLFQQDQNFVDYISQQVKAMFDKYETNQEEEEDSNSTTRPPVWKVYESLGEEPFLVNVTCQIPTRRDDGRTLRTVYAIDQHHRTIGLANYHEMYEIEKAEKEGRPPNLEYCRMVISIIPGLTESVKLKALYVSESTDDGLEEDEGVATEDLDYADDRRSDMIAQGDIIAESPWIVTPGATPNLQESLT
jgi:hypothetical protein